MKHLSQTGQGVGQRHRARPAPTLIRCFSEADDHNCVFFPCHFQLWGAGRIQLDFTRV